MTESLPLLHEWIGIAREVVADVAAAEDADPKRSKRDKAIGRWQVLLGVMMLKVGAGIATLAPTGNFRPMMILVRSLYEYLTKTRFFLKHRKEAYEQYLSIGARMYANLSKMQHPDSSLGVKVTAAYLEWKRTSGTRNEYSGNVGVSKMSLDLADKAAIRTDKDANKYTEVFQTAYGFPSLYVHGEPLLMPEVFTHLNDDTNWECREDATYMDPLSIGSLAGTYLYHWCSSVTKVYNLDWTRIRKLKVRMNQRLLDEGRLRGIL